MSNSNRSGKELSAARIKKGILIISIVLILLLALYFSAAWLLAYLQNTEHETSRPSNKIYFYDVIPNEDITKDTEYMKKNRLICYSNSLTGITQSVSSEHYSDYGGAFELMATMIESIIAGDSQTYNSLFSDKYYSKNSPKESFTPQKLYGTFSMGGILITSIDASSIVGLESAGTDTEYFQVEYLIYRNNGTFRNDVGSDACKPLVYAVREQSNGKYIIDNVIEIAFS